MDEQIVDSILAGLARAGEMGMEPAFLFDRISSMRQQDGISLDYQGQGGRAYAERNNLHVVYAFMVIESAYKENRKYLNGILDAAEQYGVKNLIFKNVDRLSRNISHANRFQELFEKKGFVFHFYEMGMKINNQSNYDEKWLLYLHILMAQRHSMKTSHDVKEVHKYKAGKGVPHFRPPDGYRWSHEERMPLIDKDRENVIRMIFDEFDAGSINLQGITDMLNARGMMTRSGRHWRKNTVHYILLNPFYAGEFSLNGVSHEGKYPAYISKERFRERLEKIGTNRGKYNSREFVFSHFLRCDTCGALLYGDIKKERYVYYTHKCSDGKQASYIPEAEILGKIDAEAMLIGMSDEFAAMLEKSFVDQVELKEKSQMGSVAAISRQIVSIEVSQKKLLQLFAKGTIPENILEAQIGDYERKKNYLIKQRQELSVDKNTYIVSVARIIETIRRFPGIYSVCPPADKREILSHIASHIIIGDRAEIIFKPPYSFILKKELRGFQDLAVTQNSVVLPQLDEYVTYIAIASREIARWAA